MDATVQKTAIGTVSATQGEVFAKGEDGTTRRLHVGDTVYEGDVIITATGSSIEIAMSTGQMLPIQEQQTVALDAEVSGSILQDPSAAAVTPLQPSEAAKVIQALTPGAATDDPNLLLEQEAAAAGLTGGGGSDGGSTFVRLIGVSETTSPTGYDFGVNPDGAPGTFDGTALPVVPEPTVSVSVQVSLATSETPQESGELLLTRPDITLVSAGAADVIEGSSGGFRPVTFYILLDAPTDHEVTVNYVITPLPGTDWGPDGDFFDGALTGTVVIPAGYAGFTVTENIVEDKLVEANGQFTITLTDPTGATIDPTAATATVTIVDDDAAPVANNDAYTTAEGSALTLNPSILANDTDLNGDNLTIKSFGQPQHGTVTVDPQTGQLVYTPEPGYDGPDSFTYMVTDGTNDSNLATVSIDVIPGDITPTAGVEVLRGEEGGAVPEDGSVAVLVTANAADDTDQLTSVTVTLPDGWTATLGANTYSGTFDLAASGQSFSEVLTVYPTGDASMDGDVTVVAHAQDISTPSMTADSAEASANVAVDAVLDDAISLSGEAVQVDEMQEPQVVSLGLSGDAISPYGQNDSGDADGSESGTVTIAVQLPEGVSLVLDGYEGSASLVGNTLVGWADLADLQAAIAALAVQVPAGFDGSISGTVTVAFADVPQDVGGESPGNNTYTSELGFDVTVNAGENIEISATGMTTTEGDAPLDVDLASAVSVALSEQGNETLQDVKITFSSLPEGTTAYGSASLDGNVLTVTLLNGEMPTSFGVTLPEDYSTVGLPGGATGDPITYTVDVTSSEGTDSSGPHNLVVNVEEDLEVSASDITAVEDQASINLSSHLTVSTASDNDASEEVTEVTVTLQGVPEGSTMTGWTNTGVGAWSWTGTSTGEVPDIVVVANWSGTITGTLHGESDELGDKDDGFSIIVSAQDDAPQAQSWAVFVPNSLDELPAGADFTYGWPLKIAAPTDIDNTTNQLSVTIDLADGFQGALYLANGTQVTDGMTISVADFLGLHYMPDSDSTAETDTFTYKVYDGTLYSDVQTVTIDTLAETPFHKDVAIVGDNGHPLNSGTSSKVTSTMSFSQADVDKISTDLTGAHVTIETDFAKQPSSTSPDFNLSNLTEMSVSVVVDGTTYFIVKDGKFWDGSGFTSQTPWTANDDPNIVNQTGYTQDTWLANVDFAHIVTATGTTLLSHLTSGVAGAEINAGDSWTFVYQDSTGGNNQARFVSGQFFFSEDGTVPDMTVTGTNDVSNTIWGSTGADTLTGANMDDYINGGVGKDTLAGGGGNDTLVGGGGGDTLTGGGGADVFRWSLGDQNATTAPVDHITDFNDGANVVNLADLITTPGDTASSLTNYLHFSWNGTNTTLEIKSGGGFSNDAVNQTAGGADQVIVFDGVNLIGANTTQEAVIASLLGSKLITD